MVAVLRRTSARRLEAAKVALCGARSTGKRGRVLMILRGPPRLEPCPSVLLQFLGEPAIDELTFSVGEFRPQEPPMSSEVRFACPALPFDLLSAAKKNQKNRIRFQGR
jgi:hypothetical protein